MGGCVSRGECTMRDRLVNMAVQAASQSFSSPDWDAR
jgi:hypothetical protein